MNIVYLGFLQTVFDWIFDKILSPIISWIGDLLGTVLSWLFEYILAPILMNVLWPLVEMVVELIIEILAEFLYSILAMFLELIDIMELMFNIFAGLEDVYMNGVAYSLLEAVFRLDAVQSAIWILVFIGILLTVFFSILAVIRSMGDINEVARPVSRVITATISALFRLITLPALGIFMILLSTALLSSIDLAFQSINEDGADTSLAAMVFVVSSLEAAQNSDYNASTASSSVTVGINDSIRKPFYIGTRDYTNVDVVGNYFNYEDFDYFLGYTGCIFLFLVLIIAGFNFIQRIFEVIVLLIVAPFFAAMMPLDDGEKMRAWQELFIGKLFTGYGTIIAMQLYLIIAPIVMSGTISFGEGSVAADYIIRMVFMMGGAYSVLKIGPSITQLISVQAGQSEQASSQMMANTTMMAARSVHRHTQQATNKIRQGVQSRQNRNLERNQAKDERALGSSGGGKRKTKVVDVNSLSKQQKQKTSAFAAKGSIVTTGRMGRFTDEKGDKRLGFNMGKMLTRGRKADGTHVTRIAGIGINRVPDGKGGFRVSKVRMPFGSWKLNENNKRQFSSINLGAVKFKRGASVVKNKDGTLTHKLGAFGCSKAFGIKTKHDDRGNVVSRTGSLNFGVMKFKPDENNKIKMNELNLGVAKLNRAEKVIVDNAGNRKTVETGGMFCSKAIGGINRSYDWNSKKSQYDTILGNAHGHNHNGDVDYQKAKVANKNLAKDYDKKQASDRHEAKWGAPEAPPPKPVRLSKVGGQRRRPQRLHPIGGGGPKGAAANQAHGAAQKAAAKQARQTAAAAQKSAPVQKPSAAKIAPPAKAVPTAKTPTPAQKSTPMQNTSKARGGPPNNNPGNRNRRRKK